MTDPSVAAFLRTVACSSGPCAVRVRGLVKPDVLMTAPHAAEATATDKQRAG